VCHISKHLFALNRFKALPPGLVIFPSLPRSNQSDRNMASSAEILPPGKMNFPGPIGTKRRRMRSGGNVSSLGNDAPMLENISEEKTTQTSKCKGTTTIPIFLKSKLAKFEEKFLRGLTWRNFLLLSSNAPANCETFSR
jgi:hypothetical protein